MVSRFHAIERLRTPVAFFGAIACLFAVSLLRADEVIERGKLIYEKQCVECHGESGEGETTNSPSLLRGQEHRFAGEEDRQDDAGG